MFGDFRFILDELDNAERNWRQISIECPFCEQTDPLKLKIEGGYGAIRGTTAYAASSWPMGRQTDGG